MLKIFYYDSFEELKQNFPDKDFFFSTTKSDKWFTQMRYTSGCFLVFGKETAGLPETLLHANWDRCMRLPMREGARSLNLSNSVAVAVYEALRQLDFPGLQ
jgi:tRNA (cytidine/uridine-2'-O-)-methyltransferase